jgi:hypothetical protein
MTRIALCYSGRPRNFRECYDNHVAHFGLGKENVDVFAHLWFDEDLVGTNFRNDIGQGTWPDSELKEWIDQNWRPKKIVYEKPRSFEHMFEDTWDPQWPYAHQKDNQISMFYGIEQVMKLKKEYEDENNFEYDYVVRMRTDLTFLKSFGDIVDYDNEYLHVFNVIPGQDWIQTGVKDFAILDIIAFGGSKVMNKYSTTYSNLQKIVESGCPTFTPDAVLGYNAIKLNNLKVQKHPWNFKIFVGNTVYQN